MTRKILLIVLITFCLTATLFSIIPVGSQGIRDYDPWYDMNDDGKIDLWDVYHLNMKYGTTGTPINKTDLLLTLQNRIDSLNSSLRDLEANLKTRMIALETSFAQLQENLSSVEEKLTETQTIRFYSPDETMNNQTERWKTAAGFTCTPRNATDNAILQVYTYFRYTSPAYTPISFQIVINGIRTVYYAGLRSTEYEWSGIFWYPLYVDQPLLKPNQDIYRIRFDFHGNDNYPVYVKDVNILLEVMDGLPPS
jgi:hypothetical protein